MGEQITVCDKSGAMVEAAMRALAVGRIVNFYVKLAGQTRRTMGIDMAVDDNGDVDSQHKSARKANIYFKSIDDTVRANNTIIPSA